MKKLIVLALVMWSNLAVNPAIADFTFGRPTNLGLNINGSYGEWDPSISTDGSALYFNSERPGGHGESDLWVSKSKSMSDDWGEAINLGPIVNSAYREAGPSISSDGLTLYFDSSRPGGSGAQDLWVARRAGKDEDWAPPVSLGPVVNSPAEDQNPCISTDGMELFFESRRVGSTNYDLWVTRRDSLSAAWGPPVNLGPVVNSRQITRSPSISIDGLWMFLSALRDEELGLHDFDTWVTNRPSTSDPWTAPVNPGPTLNSAFGEGNPDISRDGLSLFFASDQPGGLGEWDIWQTPIIPTVDFNGDTHVDIEDLVTLIEHWGQDEPSVDMGPMPWGDGVVDVADLEVLMSYWAQEPYDPHLLAHWKLDEAEGDIAYDSAAEYDAAVIGNALWQPEIGQVRGAIQLDGIDDCVDVPLVLNPADTAFSVFAWVKGGVPGQVIISQEDGVDWLLTDTQGHLVTALESDGRWSGGLLISDTIVTDDNWHRVGFIWDGMDRILYVDDAEVARDTLGGLKGPEGSLYIGTGKGLEPGSYWSGMIDDVRIYDRVVAP